MARKLAKGQFDLEDMADQLSQMQRMGGMSGLMALLPGVQKIKKQLAEANISDKSVDRQIAIIRSMTPKERKKPDILAASRKRRIAAGSGVEVSEVNRLLKQHRQMQDAMKFMAKDGGKGFAKMARMMGAGGAGGAGGALPPGVSQADLDRAKEMMSRPGGLAGLGGSPGGGGLPGLGGLPFTKTKN
jgi:signal recognition particle subunit SRP54